jgi:hypothetical protein
MLPTCYIPDPVYWPELLDIEIDVLFCERHDPDF